MLSYILILNIHTVIFTRCVSLKNMNPKREGLRIVGGRDALPGEYPYVLRIEAEIIRNYSTVNMALCTCACIKPTWSLTAAHCIVEMESLTLWVKRFVLRYKPSPPEIAFVKVLSMFVIPNYDRSYRGYTDRNDIGILKTEIIALSSYARVSSVDYSSLYGLKVYAVGYGLMLDDHGSFNDTFSLNKPLKVVDAMIIKCDIKMSPLYCLASIREKWTPLAPGDSGGPVLHSSGIVGINTASSFENYRKMILFPDHKIKSFIGIITSVSPFMDWIVNMIK